MSEPLSSEEEAQYSKIIDGILATVDLETVTRKKIRAGLEKSLGGKDLSTQKDAIKALIEQRFDAISTDAPPPSSAPVATKTESDSSRTRANGHSYDDDAEADGDEIKVSSEPPKKKIKKESGRGTEDADAKLARMLQAQEDQLTSRATRGGGSKSKPVKKKAPKKKSDNKVRPEDDSDVENGDEPGTKRKAGGGFQKPFNLSEPLAALTGESTLSRPQVVKKLWEHIKANELQDPTDKRQIRCDEKMQAVFKQARVDMFQMNKLVGNHLYPVDE